jgi:hypothetical protein
MVTDGRDRCSSRYRATVVSAACSRRQRRSRQPATTSDDPWRCSICSDMASNVLRIVSSFLTLYTGIVSLQYLTSSVLYLKEEHQVLGPTVKGVALPPKRAKLSAG